MNRWMRAGVALCAGVLVVLMVSSCASIILGGNQTIPVNSSPSGATVKVISMANNMEVASGITPCQVNLKRGAGFFSSASYKVVIEKAGSKSAEVLLTGNINGWYILGNFVFGGLVGWIIVDPLTGAMWTLNPKDINAGLGGTASLDKKEGITVLLKDEVPEAYRSAMRPVVVPES